MPLTLRSPATHRNRELPPRMVRQAQSYLAGAASSAALLAAAVAAFALLASVSTFEEWPSPTFGGSPATVTAPPTRSAPSAAAQAAGVALAPAVRAVATDGLSPPVATPPAALPDAPGPPAPPGPPPVPEPPAPPPPPAPPAQVRGPAVGEPVGRLGGPTVLPPVDARPTGQLTGALAHALEPVTTSVAAALMELGLKDETDSLVTPASPVGGVLNDMLGALGDRR